jgi:hypothetical protein
MGRQGPVSFPSECNQFREQASGQGRGFGSAPTRAAPRADRLVLMAPPSRKESLACRSIVVPVRPAGKQGQ